MPGRHVPLILVASASATLADSVALQLRRAGNVVYVAHSADGCLRVAASIGPDVVLLDPELPHGKRFEHLIKAHPMCARAQVLHLSGDSTLQPRFSVPRTPPAAAAGPHAA